MNGRRWLQRLCRDCSRDERLYRIRGRIASKIRQKSLGGVRKLAKEFQLRGSTSWISIVGCWSQSLDAHARQELGRRLQHQRALPTGCACPSRDASTCWEIRYGVLPHEVEADGGPCQCLCHEWEIDEDEW